MAKIVLVDDHQIVRRGLRSVLEQSGDFSVVGEAADGFEAVKLVERLKPDILITDLTMPSLNGMEVTRQVTHRCPATRVIVLSMHATEEYVLQALANGAMGYVLKDADMMEMVNAIHSVLNGQHYLSPPLTARAIEIYIRRANEDTFDPYDTLTMREREVLHLAAEGHTNAEVAARLSISPRTAEVHRANLMRKLGLRTQTNLIRYAIRRGILPLEE